MRKAATIGNEHIRHEAKLKEIEDFYEIINRHNIKEGKPFVYSTYNEPPICWCFNIDHENLKIEFTEGAKKSTFVDDMNYCSMTVADYKRKYQ